MASTTRPLWLSVRFGAIIAMLSVLASFRIMVGYFAEGSAVVGWTSLATLISFLFGMVFIQLGVIGLYLGKLFDEAKRRPLYVVASTVNVASSSAAADGRP